MVATPRELRDAGARRTVEAATSNADGEELGSRLSRVADAWGYDAERVSCSYGAAGGGEDVMIPLVEEPCGGLEGESGLDNAAAGAGGSPCA